jgi:hypothetical protein
VGTADILVGVYLAAGIIALINKQTLLSFVLLVATGWAKSEGQVIAGTAFILMFISFKQYRLIFPLILSAILGPWFLFTKFSTMESSQYFKFSEIYARPWLEYFVYSIHAFREEFRNLPKWNLLFWFFPVAAIINVRKILKHIPSLIILSIILVQLGMYIVIFTITPEEQASFIAAAISRLTLHIAPGILVITSYWFSRDFAKK